MNSKNSIFSWKEIEEKSYNKVRIGTLHFMSHLRMYLKSN